MIFVLLLTAFWFFGGFDFPEVTRNDRRGERGITRAGRACVGLYVIGCAMVVWGRDLSDLLANGTPPAAYRIIGILLAGAGGLWMAMLKESAALVERY